MTEEELEEMAKNIEILPPRKPFFDEHHSKAWVYQFKFKFKGSIVDDAITVLIENKGTPATRDEEARKALAEKCAAYAKKALV